MTVVEGPHSNFKYNCWKYSHTKKLECIYTNSDFKWVPSYEGLPEDAIKAGIDKDRGIIYVGRAEHEGEMLPAKVCPNHGGAFVPWGGEEHSKFKFEVHIIS